MAAVITFIVQNWEILATVASLGASAFVMWLSSRYMRRSECASIQTACAAVHQKVHGDNAHQDKRLDEANAERTRIETLLKGLPTAKDVHTLQLSITELNGRLNSFEATMRGQADVLKIVQQQTTHMNAFLMEHGHGAKR